VKQLFELSRQRSKQFLKYLNAALRDPQVGMIRGNGRASFEGGHFVVIQSANFEYSGNQLFATWRIVLREDGSLVSIENQDAVDDGSQHELLLSQFISSVLQQVLAEKTERYFRRNYFSAICGGNLPGEYWLPGFRFAPLYFNDNSHLMNAERIFVIDQNIAAIDRMNATEISMASAAQYAAYLSFILDLGLETPRHEERYFLVQEGTSLRMQRKSTQLVDKACPAQMPEKGAICNLAPYKGSVFDKHRYAGQDLYCPVETRKMLRGVKNMSEEDKDAFNSCCLLYQLGSTIGANHPTVRTSYECAAVDALVRKGNPAGLAFRAFMTKYASGDAELYELMYGKIRSAHFHAGEFPLGELEFSHDFIRGPDEFITFNVLMAAHREIRKVILSWLDERTGFSAGDPDT
jgi:hypothetical protein